MDIGKISIDVLHKLMDHINKMESFQKLVALVGEDPFLEIDDIMTEVVDMKMTELKITIRLKDDQLERKVEGVQAHLQNLICPDTENHAEMIALQTNFWISEENEWFFDCHVCGGDHRLKDQPKRKDE